MHNSHLNLFLLSGFQSGIQSSIISFFFNCYLIAVCIPVTVSKDRHGRHPYK